MKAVAKALGISRSNLPESASKPRGPYAKAQDAEFLAEIAPVVEARGSYGYRRAREPRA